ncbi:hypothetical protein QX226_00450 [Vibrio vulnificus]|uniref:hypothetical protein n=1 Tax=Vibrio vulnificus TaxID=672 RepID=UPI001A2B5C61|nr:hypothetical protein [Vibrio vulnificus]MDS1769791.1 hypothetical protein [Vibrio vulnificus]MDS1851458.1 hypothetical protein [Vibrio vulnificus]HAS6320408.1 hypothetical protein [Vibrio vulnificus]HDY7591544.1 hypothetical protein [Vibrio vulnificus]HDY8175394.1 hypothetical protein [Vibrio vulnificus]
MYNKDQQVLGAKNEYGKKYQPRDNGQRVSEVMCLCGHRICDSEGIIGSRCVKLLEGKALSRCKRWVKVPVVKKLSK